MNPRACIALKYDRLTLYLNRAAAIRIADRIREIAESEPSRNFEIHIAQDLDPEGLLNPEKRSGGVFTLIEERVSQHVVRAGKPDELESDAYVLPFDLNIMMASEDQLNEMEEDRRTGILKTDPSAS